MRPPPFPDGTRTLRHDIINLFPTMKTKIITVMSTIALCTSCRCGDTAGYPTDTMKTGDGKTLSLTFFAHSSLLIDYDGLRIYTDPVSAHADYARLPKADVILISHEHYDHCDPAAVEQLSKPGTLLIANAGSLAALGRQGTALSNGQSVAPLPGLRIEAVPAYNITPGHTDFHPQGGRDNGYILSLGDTRIYLAGDSENTPEMMALRDIDIAFLPVNQPYTMTVEQAAEAVHAIRPAIFYPYHYGQVEQRTDLARLTALLEDLPETEMRIRPLE